MEVRQKVKLILLRLRRYLSCIVWMLFGLWAVLNWLIAARNQNKLNNVFIDEAFKSLSREKRFIYMNNNRRLCLPKGSYLALSGILSLPFLGNLPIGYGSALTVAVPFTIDFDKLGMTDDDNRFGYFDFLNLTGMFNFPEINMSALRLPSMFQNFPPHPFVLPSIWVGKRRKRTDWNNFPGINYAGGDREIVYQMVEQFISNFGVDGAACVRRAICEMHEGPFLNHGFFKEALELLLSPSLATLAEYRLGPYLEAEIQGKTKKDCRNHFGDACNYSIFSPKTEYQSNEPTLRYNSSLESEPIYENESSNIPLHREKRFFMIGPRRNIIFPPTTAFVATPTLNLPFMRDLPEGFSSEISYSVPFTFSFDDLGLTSVLNQFGHIPFLKKKKRHVKSASNPGGSRETMYAIIADVLNNIGLNGRNCLLRTICEVQEMPLVHHGLFGEFFQLLLTPSLESDADERLSSFVKAEKMGRNCGDCSNFDDLCPKSFFTNPGAGLKFSTEEEILVCRKNHIFDYRNEEKNFVQKVKKNLENGYPETKAPSKFLTDVAKQIHFQNNLKQLKDI